MTHMMRKNGSFVISIFVLLIVLFTFGISFERRYGKDIFVQAELDGLKQELQRQQLRLALKDFQIDTLKGQKQNRMPASSSHLSVHIKWKRLWTDFKETHRVGDCLKVLELAERIEREFSFVAEYPQVLFLKADCYLSMNKKDKALDVYSSLIDLFPDQEVTAHALLKMAVVLTELNQKEGALEILRVLKRQFPDNKDLIRAAEQVGNELGVRL